MAKTKITFLTGPDGWVRADERSGRNVVSTWFVNFGRDKKGQWHPSGALLVDPPTAATVRATPFGRIVLAVNASSEISDALEHHLNDKVPPFSGKFFELFSGFVKEEPIRLRRPRGRNLDDSFYAQVADAYRLAVARGLNPRAAIAEAASVSPDVAGRWIYEARKTRGLIPKTTPGKVTV
jgi:hypothetical protein